MIQNLPLNPAPKSATIPTSDSMPAFFKQYLEARYIALMQEVNELRRMLGRNPKRCPHCGGELK